MGGSWEECKKKVGGGSKNGEITPTEGDHSKNAAGNGIIRSRRPAGGKGGLPGERRSTWKQILFPKGCHRPRKKVPRETRSRKIWMINQLGKKKKRGTHPKPWITRNGFSDWDWTGPEKRKGEKSWKSRVGPCRKANSKGENS